MKHKVGDFVIIKENLTQGPTPYGGWTTSFMLKYRGRKSKIIYVDPEGEYLLCIDKGRWAWDDSMFEGDS